MVRSRAANKRVISLVVGLIKLVQGGGGDDKCLGNVVSDYGFAFFRSMRVLF